MRPPSDHDLDSALDELQAIHLHLARAERLRALRARPVAAAAVTALLAGLVQHLYIDAPLATPGRWLLLWAGAAALAGTAVATEIATRSRRADHHGSADTPHAWQQFAPCLAVGGLLTGLVAARLPQHLALLPGLWQLLFGLGCFAAWRILPHPTWLVGSAFLASGTACLWMQEQALQAWAMALPFGLGLALLATILHRASPAAARR